MLKNLTGSGSWKFRGVLALGLLVSSGAWAVAIQPDDPQPTDVPYVDGWTIDGLSGFPAGPWFKNLGGPGDLLGVNANDPQTFNENLVLVDVGPDGTSLTRWTGTITGGDWVWDEGTLTSPFGALLVDGVLSDFNKTITFTFILDTADTDPDPDFRLSIPFTITQSLLCTAVGDICTDGLTVVENAVPEPGTLLLLAGGLAGLAGLRRRRYS